MDSLATGLVTLIVVSLIGRGFAPGESKRTLTGFSAVDPAVRFGFAVVALFTGNFCVDAGFGIGIGFFAKGNLVSLAPGPFAAFAVAAPTVDPIDPVRRSATAMTVNVR